MASAVSFLADGLRATPMKSGLPGSASIESCSLSPAPRLLTTSSLPAPWCNSTTSTPAGAVTFATSVAGAATAIENQSRSSALPRYPRTRPGATIGVASDGASLGSISQPAWGGPQRTVSV